MEITITPYLLWNLVTVFVIVPIGFLLRSSLSELSRLSILVNKTREEIAKDYVTREEIERDMTKLLDQMNRISDKIDKLTSISTKRKKSRLRNKCYKLRTKAKNIISINLKNKSYIADYMIIASGTSSRHLQALSEILVTELKKIGLNSCRIEGRNSNDWKLVDAIDVIIHIFHPEKREFYDLEKMWSEEIPKERAMI